MALLCLALAPIADLPASITSSLKPEAFQGPVEREVAPFGPAYGFHAFPINLPDGTEAEEDASKASGNATGGGRDMGSRKKNVKLDEEDLEVDWYELMQLENGENATDEEIRVAYRKRCLDTHPDKQPDGSDVLFKKVQRGFEILGNPEARRSFDSSRPFDDTIPGENVPEDKFFDTFNPVFERNKKWSALPDMPSLGDDSTPHAEIKKIYDAWLTFRTWRDFSNDVELEKIDEGMQREEKRWYQRQNQRLLDKANKDELKRVRTLVDRAMKNDPRLRRIREEADKLRIETQAAREKARRAGEEAERRARDEAKEAEKRSKVDERQKAIDTRMLLKTSMAELTEFLEEHDLMDYVPTNKLLACKIRKPNLTWVFKNVTPEQAVEIRDKVCEADPEVCDGKPELAEASEEPDSEQHVEAVLVFNLVLKSLERRKGRDRYNQGIKALPPGVEEPKLTLKPKKTTE